MCETDQDLSGTPLFTYSDAETGQPRELPFAIGVLSDLSGNGELSSRPLAEREFDCSHT